MPSIGPIGIFKLSLAEARVQDELDNLCSSLAQLFFAMHRNVNKKGNVWSRLKCVAVEPYMTVSVSNSVFYFCE